MLTGSKKREGVASLIPPSWFIPGVIWVGMGYFLPVSRRSYIYITFLFVFLPRTD